MNQFRFSGWVTTGRFLLALALPVLLLAALLPAAAQDDDDGYDGPEFTWVHLNEDGRITVEDLSDPEVTYHYRVCIWVAGEEGWDCSHEYASVSTPYHEIRDWDSSARWMIYMHAYKGDDLIPGTARTFPPYDSDAAPTPVPVVLTAPTGLAIAESGVVSWDGVAQADHYFVDWQKNTDDWNPNNRSNVTSFAIPDFDAAADYRVDVWAVASDDTTGPVSRATWLPPGAPANLAISASGQVSWDEVSDADHYLLDWQTNQDAWSRDNQVSATTFEIANFDPVADYRVEVRAVATDSAEGPAASATRFPPEAPSNLAISDSGAVTWDAVTDAVHYLVNWLKGDDDWGSDNRVTSNSFDLPSFDAGAHYGALVRAVAADGAQSPAVLVTRTPPDSPNNLVINENGEVSWESVDEASHYIVDWRLFDGNWNEDNQVDAQALAVAEAQALNEDDRFQAQAQDTLAAQADDMVTYSIPGFDPTKNYETNVYSVNEDNIRSLPSRTIFEAVQPTRATNLRISSSGYVSWSAATDASWYHTGWRETGGSWTTNTREQGTGFQIPGFDPAKSYDASVQAVIEIGENAITGEVVFAHWRPGTPGGGGGTFDGAVAEDFGPSEHCIAPHPGTTLIVCLNHGWLAALDYGQGVSLHAPASCSYNALPAFNDALHVDCDAAGNLVVTQLNPQHPQDGRRDILVFDPAVTTCYRAYEYLDGGEIEIWYRGCH